MKKLLLIIVFTLISCGNEQELIDISLALDWYPNSNHAGIYYGIENGYFEENEQGGWQKHILNQSQR